MCACAVLGLGVPTAELRIKKCGVRRWETVYIITLYLFLHFVKDKIKKLIVSLEHARHCLFFLGGAHFVVSCALKTDVVEMGRADAYLHDLL